MEDPVDLLVYSKWLRKPRGEITLFDENAKFIRLPRPPANSSLDTAKEFLTIQGATFLRGPGMIKSIRKHDRDPAFAIKMYLTLFGLEFDEDYITNVVKESTILIKYLKNHFNRPRPSQLSPYFGIDLEVLNSRSNKTPSYPSGHATQARLIAEIYSAKYPEHRSNLIKASEECGGGRIMAGFHYPSDHKAGIYLAKRLFKTLKRSKKIEYNQTIDLTTSKGGK
jgi:membrane-associated phospholipid phosphatase